jgi:hypothetical protein
MAGNRIEKIVLSIHSFYTFGVHSDEELGVLENYVKALKEIRDKGESPYSDIDSIIAEGEDAIERRYTYLEEVASLGNNWW